MNQNNWKLLRPMLLVFVFLSAFFVTATNALNRWGFDKNVLLAGNLIVFGVSLLAFMISVRALKSPNPQAFVRAMYGSFIIRFFVLALAAFIYIMVVKKQVNKPALFTCMGLYIVYSFLEIAALLKLLKQKKNA